MSATSDTDPAILTRPRDPVRTAGILLLIGFCVDLAILAVQRHWGWTPTSMGLADTTFQMILGAGLIYYGRAVSLPTLVFIATVALISLALSTLKIVPIAQDDEIQAAATAVSVPLVLGLLRASPFFLLLVGKPARLRYTLGIVLYVLYQVVHLAIAALSVYVMEWFNRR